MVKFFCNSFFGAQVLFVLLVVHKSMCGGEVCDRRPLGFTTEPLPPDNEYMLEIDDIRDNQYIPGHKYTVRLRSRDGKSTFIAFSISLQPDNVPNANNPRRPMLLKPGHLECSPKFPNTKFNTKCNDTITEADVTAKTSVEVIWIAPDKDNKCVTIFAIVAIRADVWYSFEGPLSRRVCEDRRKAEDMQPIENDNCQVCEDARYQLTFQGKWSLNTHQYMYPKKPLVAQFSDIVGASHSSDFIMYKNSADASKGIRMLAEQGNTTELELEIIKYLGTSVRTILKASAPPQTNQSTITSFRVTNRHHLITLATGMLPSPDWFLGVANYELCEARTNTWAENITYNLYPLDAGTDKGTSFESANEETSPPQPISSALNTINIPKEEVKPFAKLVFTLIRTYANPDCNENITTERPGQETMRSIKKVTKTKMTMGNKVKPYWFLRAQGGSCHLMLHSEEPASVDPASTPDCPVSEWGDWLNCEADGDRECVNNKAHGYRIRMRKYLGDITDDCLKDFPSTDLAPCSVECNDEGEMEDDTEDSEN